MKKAIDLFMELPEPYKTQAIVNTREYNKYDEFEKRLRLNDYEDIPTALSKCFDWSKTPEGIDYWLKLKNEYERKVNELKQAISERHVQDSLIIDGVVIKIEATIIAESSAKAQNIWNKFRNLNKDILYYER